MLKNFDQPLTFTIAPPLKLLYHITLDPYLRLTAVKRPEQTLGQLATR